MTTALGWWCFPWGLGTPIVLLQNVASATEGPNKRALTKLLMTQGIDIEDIEVDEHGVTSGQRAIQAGVISVLHSMIWADGSADERELDTAVDIATKMLGDLADPASLREIFASSDTPPPAQPERIPMDARVILMNAAAAIAAADEVIEESEREELRALAAKLALPEEVAATLIASLDEDDSAESEGVKAIAAEVLGVAVGTSMAELHTALQTRKVESVQIEDEGERRERIEQLDWAYGVLTGAPSAA